MGIVTMDPPGRRPGRTRLSDDDVLALVRELRGGNAAGDGEIVRSYQTASQRARSAKRRVQAHGVVADHRVWREGGGYVWALTPPEAKAA